MERSISAGQIDDMPVVTGLYFPSGSLTFAVDRWISLTISQRVRPMADDEHDGWRLVGAWLQGVIDERGLSMAAVSRDSGVSHKSLRRLLDGEPLKRRDRLGTLARSLGFRADAFDLVRRGEEPAPLETTTLVVGTAHSELGSLEARARGTVTRPSDEERLTALEQRLGRIETAVEQLLEREAP